MEQAICNGFVQNNPAGYAVCTDALGNLLPWVESPVVPLSGLSSTVGLTALAAVACFLFWRALKWRPATS